MLPVQLIVNADDFGFTRDVNEGIVEAHERGILTATTLMANGNAFGHAVELAQRAPSLDVGCHLVMVQGYSVLKPAVRLPATFRQLLSALAGREIRPVEEARAQVKKILDAGIRISHIDSHKHTHLLPPVMDAVLCVSQEFGIPWVRRPFDFELDAGVSLQQQAVTLGMRMLRPSFTRKLAGLRTTDHFTGFQKTGSLDTASLQTILERLPEGTTELMCHPGRHGSELARAATRLKQSRAVELAALTSLEAREVVARRRIRLISYRDL